MNDFFDPIYFVKKIHRIAHLVARDSNYKKVVHGFVKSQNGGVVMIKILKNSEILHVDRS